MQFQIRKDLFGGQLGHIDKGIFCIHQDAAKSRVCTVRNGDQCHSRSLRSHKTVLIYCGYGFIAGGNGSDGGDNIYKLDLETLEFITLDVTLPHQVFKGGWCYVDEYLYLFGGTKGPRLTTIYRFNMETYELDLLEASFPYQISQSRCAYDGNGNIYIFGGTNESNKLLTDVFKFNIEEGTLTLLDSKLEYVTANASVFKVDNGDGKITIMILCGNNDYHDLVYYLEDDQVLKF